MCSSCRCGQRRVQSEIWRKLARRVLPHAVASLSCLFFPDAAGLRLLATPRSQGDSSAALDTLNATQPGACQLLKVCLSVAQNSVVTAVLRDNLLDARPRAHRTSTAGMHRALKSSSLLLETHLRCVTSSASGDPRRQAAPPLHHLHVSHPPFSQSWAARSSPPFRSSTTAPPRAPPPRSRPSGPGPGTHTSSCSPSRRP